MFYFLDSSNSERAQKWRDMPDCDSPLSQGAKAVKGLLSVRFFLHCAHNPSLTVFMMVLAYNHLAERVHAGCLYIWAAESKVQLLVHMCCSACKASEKR